MPDTKNMELMVCHVSSATPRDASCSSYCDIARSFLYVEVILAISRNTECSLNRV